MKGEIRCGYATNVGCLRDHNEDAYSVEPELGLWVVADGMGGHEGGEIASEITITTVSQAIRAGRTLKEAFAEAHAAVKDAGASGVGKTGMGSTVVALRINDNDYEIAWVGDSRIYLWDGKEFRQISHDHSYVQLLVDNQLIEKNDVRSHPMKHIVNQAIGNCANDDVDVDTLAGRLVEGCRFLLCSDGLSDELTDEEIASVICSKAMVQEAVDRLIDMALDSGGSDNITAMVVELAG